MVERVFGEHSSQAGKVQYLLAECLWNQVRAFSLPLSLSLCYCITTHHSRSSPKRLNPAQGKMKEARPYCERSLSIRERVLGGHHLHVAMSLCGLGGTIWIFLSLCLALCSCVLRLSQTAFSLCSHFFISFYLAPSSSLSSSLSCGDKSLTTFSLSLYLPPFLLSSSLSCGDKSLTVARFRACS
jgi:hypothetical protein